MLPRGTWKLYKSFFSKKLFGVKAPIWTQKWDMLSYLLIFKNFAQWKGPRVMWKFYNFIFEKTLFQENWTIFGPKMTSS